MNPKFLVEWKLKRHFSGQHVMDEHVLNQFIYFWACCEGYGSRN